MRRSQRQPVSPGELRQQLEAWASGKPTQGAHPDAANRLLLDALSDREDCLTWLSSRPSSPTRFPSRAEVRRDPAPPYGSPGLQGFQEAYLVTDAAQVREVLSDPQGYTNAPYAELAGGSFMLALQPGGKPDWHGVQRGLAQRVLGAFEPTPLAQLAQVAIHQGGLTELGGRSVDLVRYAEQVALRWVALLYGFPQRDHGLLERCCRVVYRALQYQNFGRHFVTEPLTLPAAEQALAQLQQRCAELIDVYAQRRRSPLSGRGPGDPLRERLALPDGVFHYDHFALDAIKTSVLARLAADSCELTGNERATVAAGLIAGSVGNIASSVAIAYRALRRRSWGAHQEAEAATAVDAALDADPPVRFLPRRSSRKLSLGGVDIAADRDLVLMLRGSEQGCPHSFGEPGAHPCVGKDLARPLVQAIVWHLLRQCQLDDLIDPSDGQPIEPHRLWGFGYQSWPLQQLADPLRRQNCLNVAMRIRSPVSENAARLREVIRSGAPLIESSLRDSRHVHFAWFELLEVEGLLVLHTVYDGEFEAYVQHFALRVADLFDQLFQYLDNPPPLPVSDHPNAFVETIRRFNRAPVGEYFFSAYPSTTVTQILPGGRP